MKFKKSCRAVGQMSNAPWRSLLIILFLLCEYFIDLSLNDLVFVSGFTLKFTFRGEQSFQIPAEKFDNS